MTNKYMIINTETNAKLFYGNLENIKKHMTIFKTYYNEEIINNVMNVLQNNNEYVFKTLNNKVFKIQLYNLH